MKPLKNGLLTGLILQLSLGPVFFYIINLTISKSIYVGLIGVLAVTIVDFIYMSLAVRGTGGILIKPKLKRLFQFLGPIILIIFGILVFPSHSEYIFNIYGSAVNSGLLQSFINVCIITLSNPLTIIFFSGLFTAKAIEYNYTKSEANIYGVGVVISTLIFMTFSVFIFSIFKPLINNNYVDILNKIVAATILIYGLLRLKDAFKNKTT